jgi:HAD superfamily hydrolase (TIGR01509 family)
MSDIDTAIRAMIFDLDGTLVQTEKLKAVSYARAVIDLCPRELTEEQIIEAFKDVVGLPRREVATSLVDRFDLAEKATERIAEYGVKTPWQAYVQHRLHIYEKMLSDPDVIRHNQWPHNMALLQEAGRSNCKVGLASMSHCEQVNRILSILEMTNAFDFVATRDDVERGKPDPEIYLLVARELSVMPANSLVIEDSPSGVQAALNAGMQVVGVATPFTRRRLHESGLLPDHLIVDGPEQVNVVVAQLLQQQSGSN